MSKVPSSDVAFTPAVKRVQEERGSRDTYARIERERGVRGLLRRTERVAGRLVVVRVVHPPGDRGVLVREREARMKPLRLAALALVLGAVLVGLASMIWQWRGGEDAPPPAAETTASAMLSDLRGGIEVYRGLLAERAELRQLGVTIP